MSITTPRDLPTEATTMRSNDLIEIYNATSEQNVKIQHKNMRGQTKVLWTGPLSVVSTPTILDSGEAFSDWDLIEVHFHLTNDSDITNNKTPYQNQQLNFSQLRIFSDSGSLRIDKLSDTTFQLGLKTVALGNIQRIIGISL